MLLRHYTKKLLANANSNRTDMQAKVLGQTLCWLGARHEQTIRALKYHCANYPAKDGTGYLGYLDSAHTVNTELVEIRGWLVHIDSRIVALTFFGKTGALMADYGFPRPDLVPLLPHLPQVDLSGFRAIVPASDLVKGNRRTFQGFLADQATRFGSFAIESLPESNQQAASRAQHN